MSGVNSIASQRENLCGHLHSDAGAFFYSNIYKGRLSFLNVWITEQYKNIESYTKMLLWQIYIAGNYKMYLGHMQSDWYFYKILTKSGVCQEIFIKYPHIK